MTDDQTPDALRDAFLELRALRPDPARDARVRARCHAAMTPCEPPARPTSESALRPAVRPVADVLLAASVSLYGLVVIVQALRLAGIL